MASSVITPWANLLPSLPCPFPSPWASGLEHKYLSHCLLLESAWDVGLNLLSQSWRPPDVSGHASFPYLGKHRPQCSLCFLFVCLLLPCWRWDPGPRTRWASAPLLSLPRPPPSLFTCDSHRKGSCALPKGALHICGKPVTRSEALSKVFSLQKSGMLAFSNC